MTDLGSGSSGVVLMYYVGSSRRALGLERVERVCGRAGNWVLGLGEQMTAHQEKYVAWVFKAWLGFKIGGHSGNLVGNYVGGIDGWKPYPGVVGNGHCGFPGCMVAK